MDSKMQGSPQRSALQNLIHENQRIRQTLNEYRKEKEDLLRNMRKVQGEAKSFELKLKTVENQLQRALAENRRFMETVQSEKKDKIRFVTELSELKNNVVRKDAEITSLKSQIGNLETQNERLRKQTETTSLQSVNSIKQKQTMVNSVKILETKLEAAEMQKKYQTSRVAQLEQQLSRTREQLTIMTKKYHERQIGVQAIYRDEKQTKQKLLEEFQTKLSDKDKEMTNQLQKYLNQNAVLKQRLIELRGGLY